jgi:hypothetical protein
MDLNELLIISFAAFLAIVVALIVFNRIHAEQRTQQMQSAAHEIGFDFRGDIWNHQLNAQKLGTELFKRGTRRRFANLMVGNIAGFDTSLFDYSYTISAGEDSTTYTQTVVAFSQELWLPHFELRLEGFFDHITEVFVTRDIDFDFAPEFSRRYFLRGPDEAGIRKLFSHALITSLDTLAADEKWHIEGNVTTLIIYRSAKTIEVEELHSFLEKTSSIARDFFASPEGLSQPVR